MDWRPSVEVEPTGQQGTITPMGAAYAPPAPPTLTFLLTRKLAATASP